MLCGRGGGVPVGTMIKLLFIHLLCTTMGSPRDVILRQVFILDYLTHDAFAVHSFTKKLLGFLSGSPNLKKVYYFTDGAAPQYKNNLLT